MTLRVRAALLLVCVLWAVSFIATRVAVASTPPWTVVGLRLAFSALCFLAWGLARGVFRRVPGPRLIRQLFGLSLLGTGLHYGIQTVGMQYTTASNASVYSVTAPLTIAVLAAVVLRERLTLRKGLGILIALVGVLTVMGWRSVLALELAGHLLGDALVMASIVMWGLFTVFGKKITDELGALTVTAWVTVLGAVTMIPVVMVELRLQTFALAVITPQAWLAIAFLGIGCSFLATLLYFMALQRTQSQQVGAYLYLIPPLTALVAHFSLQEALAPSFFLGSALILVGVRLTET